VGVARPDSKTKLGLYSLGLVFRYPFPSLALPCWAAVATASRVPDCIPIPRFLARCFAMMSGYLEDMFPGGLISVGPWRRSSRLPPAPSCLILFELGCA
jgi:hypothetical protein